MRNLSFWAAIVTAAPLALAGCNTMSTASKDSGDPADHEAPLLSDSPPPWNKDVKDPYQDVGDVARANRPIEKDPDQWFKNWFMSPEARNIERSLGVD